ncbi:MAG: hypothetical protein QXF52_10210 [Thermoproteota archaeon]
MSVASNSSQLAEEKPKNIIITITLRRMELGDFEAQIECMVENESYIKNGKREFLRKEKISTLVGLERFPTLLNLQPELNGECYRGTMTLMLHPEGSTQLYPFDEYMLNITFLLSKVEVPREFIHGTTMALGIRCLIPGLSVTPTCVEKQAQDMIENEWGIGLKPVFYLRRPFTSGLILLVLFISYALLGSLPLIKPDKLSERLSICLSLFFFTISFALTQASTLQAGATLADELTAIALIGVGLFSIISIIEKTLLEGNPRLEPLQYPVEGFIMLFLSFLINVRLAYYAGLANQYPWIEFPFLLIPVFTTVGILYGFVSKTIFFLLRMRRKTVS